MAPINGWIQCLSYTLITATINSLAFISFYIAYATTTNNKENVEYKDFFSFVELVQSKGYSFATSKFDENVFACLAGRMFILHLIIFIQLFKSKKTLCALCNVYNVFEFAVDEINDDLKRNWAE